jgi:hypothetical protein
VDVETISLESNLFLKMAAKSLVVQDFDKGSQPLVRLCGLSLAAPLNELKYCHVMSESSGEHFLR